MGLGLEGLGVLYGSSFGFSDFKCSGPKGPSNSLVYTSRAQISTKYLLCWYLDPLGGLRLEGFGPWRRDQGVGLAIGRPSWS